MGKIKKKSYGQNKTYKSEYKPKRKVLKQCGRVYKNFIKTFFIGPETF